MITPAQIAAQRLNEIDSSRARVCESSYERFKREHGIPMAGVKELSRREVLVASDGWEWSDAENVEQGVAVPPPTDAEALKKQKLFYWAARRHFDEQEMQNIDDEIAAYRDQAEGHYGVVPTSAIDRLLARRAWLAADIELCDLMAHRIEADTPLTWPCEHLSRCWWGEPYDRLWTHTEFAF